MSIQDPPPYVPFTDVVPRTARSLAIDLSNDAFRVLMSFTERVTPIRAAQHIRRFEKERIFMPNYRVDFEKQIFGLPFTIGSVEIHRARDPDRARRAAELKFARQYGLGDWRERADSAVVAQAGDERR